MSWLHTLEPLLIGFGIGWWADRLYRRVKGIT